MLDHSELKEKRMEKELDNARMRDLTLKAFDEIKDDCLKSVIVGTIECDFEHGVSLYDYEIIDFVCKRLGYETRGVHFDSWIGVGNKLSQNFMHLHCTDSQTYSENERLLKDIDYKLLSRLVCDYIKSKGFKSRKATHRFTEEKLELMEFTISKYSLDKLLNAKVSDVVTKSEMENEEDDPTVDIFLKVLVIILLFGIVVFFNL